MESIGSFHSYLEVKKEFNEKNNSNTDDKIKFLVVRTFSNEELYAVLKVDSKTYSKASNNKFIELEVRGNKTKKYIVLRSDDIIDIEKKLEAALLTAEQTEKFTKEYLKENEQNFQRMSPEMVTKIAKICAIKSPELTAEFFTIFHIKDEKVIFEIGKICATKAPLAFVDHFKRFYFIQLLPFCGEIGRWQTATIFSNLKINIGRGEDYNPFQKRSMNHCFENFFSLRNNISEYNDVRFLKECEVLLLNCLDSTKFKDLDYEYIIENINKIEDSYAKKQAFIWFGEALYILNSNLDRVSLKWIKEINLLDFFIKFASPDYRLPLTFALLNMNKSTQTLFNDLNGVIPEKIEQKNGPLLRLTLAKILSEGKSEEIIKTFCKKITTGKFKDQKRYLQLVDTLILLSEQKELNFEEILCVLIQNSKNLLNEINFLQKILKLGYGSKILEKENLNTNESNFSIILSKKSKKGKNEDPTPFCNLFQTVFREIVPFRDIENFSNKMENTFDSSRMPDAIYTYAAGLKGLQEESVMLCLAEFIEGVLEGDFNLKRNNITNNPHLRKIFEENPSLKPLWETSIEEFTIEIPSNTENSAKKKTATVVETADPFDLLLCGQEVDSCQKINGSPKINKGLLGYLMDGKNRLIAVKNASGKIISRALLRLLIDSENKPVLFLEKIYPPFNISTEEINAIRTMAQKKALKLGLQLVHRGGGKDYPRKIKSLGGPSPYEYVDCSSEGGLFEVKAKGIFTVDTPRIIKLDSWISQFATNTLNTLQRYWNF